jgi:hypothetical protein
MARILVAASIEPRVIVERMLAGHELRCAETMAQAEERLGDETFDLIFCTLVFDDSKMFDLLRFVKSRPEWQRIPFIGARVRAHIFRSPSVLEGAAIACRELGAAAFLDIAQYTEEPERKMREAIERILTT